MKIAVTGARGLVGQFVVAELIKNDYEVRAITRRHWDDCPCEQISGIECTDFQAFKQAVTGCDALIHLANLPVPTDEDDTTEVYIENTGADYNAMMICGLLGFKRLVIASSTCALGFSFAHNRYEVAELPIDEESPAHPDNSYGIGKLVSELAAKGMVQRFPALSIASLRISFVADKSAYPDRCRESRVNGMANYNGNMATYVDARDCARAFRLALEAPFDGAEVFYICNSDSMSLVPTEEAARQLFPHVSFKRKMAKYEAFESNEKAKRILGWQPEHTWREELGYPPLKEEEYHLAED